MIRPRTHRTAGTLAALAALSVLTAGCGAGQISQVAEQVSTVSGVGANVGDIALRNVTLAAPSDGVYQQGDDAVVQFVAVNTDQTHPDRLVSISSTAFAGGETPASSADTAIPAAGSVVFGSVSDGGPSVSLGGLSEELYSSVNVPVTFTFARAGSVTVQVPVDVPLEAQSRGSDFNFDDGDQNES